MACPLSAIEKQLECSICCETVNEPKILEACNHVFCKKCISDLVKSSKNRKSFLCPECRVVCMLPPGGVDGLKDEFRVANLVGILNAQADDKKPARILKCCLCAGEDRAVSVCDLCDLDLCEKCRWQHHKEDQDHVIYDLCVTHGKRMKHYCYKCDKIICVICFQREHSSKDHDTGPYEDFATKNLKSLTKKFDKISNRASSIEKRIEKVELLIMQARSKRMEIIDESNAAIESLTHDTDDIRKEIEALQIRLHQLESERAIRSEGMESQMKEIDSGCNVIDAEAFMVIVTGKMELLESTRTRLTQLAGERYLGDAHHEDVMESKCRLEDAESAFSSIGKNVDELERSCVSWDLGVFLFLLTVFFVGFAHVFFFLLVVIFIVISSV